MGSLVIGSTTLTSDQGTSPAGTSVTERFDQAQAYADEAWNESWEFLEQLRNQQYPVNWEAIDYETLDLMGLDGLSMSQPAQPDIDSEIAIGMPSFTQQAPSMPDVSIASETVPAMNIADPQFDIPQAPTDDFPGFGENAPSDSAISFPTAPSIDLPPVPQLSDVSIPSPPEFNIVAFEGSLPSVDITPPEPTFRYDEQYYGSDIKDALADKLLTDIHEGGSGLDEQTEQAIYDRAVSRQQMEEERAYNEALAYWSERGFTMPPGALAGQLMEVSAHIAQTREDLNNDILVQQSKLAQENTHFTLTAAIDNEKALMQLHNQVQQRAFEVAKYTVEAAVAIYGIKVEAYKAQVETYKAMAQVYEARIRVEIAKAELYKAQIEAVKARVDIDRARIDAYQAQVQSIAILIDMYKAQMQTAQIQAEVDRIRVQAYGARVEAYRARIQAITAKYQAYGYQIEGEVAKAQMFKAQVDAYTAQVQAYKARADVDVSRAQVAVELNRGQVDSYKAAIDQYRAQVQAAIAQAETRVKIEQLDVSVYESQVRQYQAELDATVKAYAARVDELRSKQELQIKEADIATRSVLAQYEMVTESIRSAAKVAGQLAASALASVSASADISHRESRSDSRSDSSTVNQSGSSNVSRNYSESTTTIIND